MPTHLLLRQWGPEWVGGCVLRSEGEGLGQVSISLPLSTLASYPLAPTGFLLELLGFPLRRLVNSTTYLLPVSHLDAHADSPVPHILTEYPPRAPGNGREQDRHDPCDHGVYFLHQGKQTTSK